MFKQILLLSHAILCKPLMLHVEGKEMQLRGLMLNTSPALLVEPGLYDEWRAATREELEAFAKKYRPGSLFAVHAIGARQEVAYFGPHAPVFQFNHKTGITEEISVNPIWGLPQKTIILWVKEDVETTIEKLLLQLNEYELDNFTEEVQDQFYWVEQEARCGLDRTQARNRLSGLLKDLRRKKEFEEYRKALENNS